MDFVAHLLEFPGGKKFFNASKQASFDILYHEEQNIYKPYKDDYKRFSSVDRHLDICQDDRDVRF